MEELEGRDDELEELELELDELEELDDPEEDKLELSGPVHPVATRLAIISGRIFFIVFPLI